MSRRVTCVAVVLVLLVAAAPASPDDVDGDGVEDDLDVCNNTPEGTAVDAEGRPLGDVDQDCFTDLDDYALFHLLFQQGSVDLSDFAMFQRGFTGWPAAAGVVIDTVTVGSPGNVDDTEWIGYGGVEYEYNIAKYEVTAGQYTAFLNAVAVEDAYGLYNEYMSDPTEPSLGCNIQRSGSSGSYSYSVEPEWTNRPVNRVSWGDAARFANWLHNGQPMGNQDLTTTENGSYDLSGTHKYYGPDGQVIDWDGLGSALLAVVREPNAIWVIPTEDEWYKAAYHKNDGVTGNYWDYPTSSDSVPGCIGDGEPIPDPDPGNYATYDCDGGIAGIGPPYYRTEVGEHEASASPFGTFDQGGNEGEWTETALYGCCRGFRGGAYDAEDDFNLHAASHFAMIPQQEYPGFRVAELP